MPIRPENKARYPKDWKQISLRIRERSGGRCECEGECGLHRTHPGPRRCTEMNGTKATWAKGKVILTVAHLGKPAQLPLFLHVTRNAMADEIFQIIGFLMPLDAEVPKWRSMMHDRASAQFLGGLETGRAGFFISLPSGASGFSPTRPVVVGASTPTPIWIESTGRRLLRKPFEAANVSTKSAPGTNMVSAYKILRSAALTAGLSKSTLRAAYCFVSAGIGARAFAVRSLLGGHIENAITNNAGSIGGAFSWTGHATLYHGADYVENCGDDNLKAMCQRCHLRYDAEHHATGRKQRARLKCASGDLLA